MNQQEIQQLKALIIATGLYYGQQIPDNVLALYVEDLADLDFASVAAAIREVRRDPKTTRFPLPAVIRARLNPIVDPDQEAAIISNSIVEMIARCGPYSTPTLDPIAMRIIQMEGGWMQICEMVTNDNLTAFKAQWRSLAKALLGKRDRNAALGLPAPSEPERLRVEHKNVEIDIHRLLRDMPKEPVA